MTARARSLIRRVHLWLGLSLGGLFVLLGLTGSALVFYTDIDALLHPEQGVQAAASPPGWNSPVWDKALATARATWPDKTGPWRFEATGSAGAIPGRYYAASGRMSATMMVWFSPDGTAVLRRDHWGDYAMTWLYELHMHLLAEKAGEVIVGYGGIMLVFLLVTGVIAWWPRGSWRKALIFKREAVPVRRLNDLHKLAGLSTLPLLLILVVTGVMLSLPAERDWLLSRAIAPVEQPPVPLSRPSHDPQISIVRALAAAHHALPRARLAWIEAPGPGTGVFKLRMQQPGDPSARFPHSYVYVDQYDGRVLAVLDADKAGASTLINNWLHPLHDASVGGLSTRILAVMVGLVPAILFVTGLLRWRLRMRSCRTFDARRSARIRSSRS